MEEVAEEGTEIAVEEEAAADLHPRTVDLLRRCLGGRTTITNPAESSSAAGVVAVAAVAAVAAAAAAAVVVVLVAAAGAAVEAADQEADLPLHRGIQVTTISVEAV